MCGCKVLRLYVCLVVRLLPSQSEVEDGMGAIGHWAIGLLAGDVSASAVLEAQAPRCREVCGDGVVEVEDEFVA